MRYLLGLCVLLASPTWTHGYLNCLPGRLSRACLPPIRHSSLLLGKPSTTALHSTIPAGVLKLSRQWAISLAKLKAKPLEFVSIPIVAALVGYVTNWVGVKMLFYPIQWMGIPIYRLPNQPLGLIGWQGIVPAKREAMAAKLVEVTISKLLKVSEVFAQLDPKIISTLMLPTLSPVVLGGIVPKPIVKHFLTSSSKDLLRHIESLVDIRALVIAGLTTNPRTLGQFFQKVGRKELSFLVESGFGFGFLLGLPYIDKGGPPCVVTSRVSRLVPDADLDVVSGKLDSPSGRSGCRLHN